DTRLAAMGEREEQQFELEIEAVRRLSGQTGHGAGLLFRQRLERGIDLSAALLAPEIGKAPALHLAAEQRADARPGKPEAQVADEIRRQHERVAERLSDDCRIDVAALRSRTITPPFAPMPQHALGRGMLHAPPVLSRGGRRWFASRKETTTPVFCRDGQD